MRGSIWMRRRRADSLPSGIDRRDGWRDCWRRCARRWDSLAPRISAATGWRVWNPGRYGEPWHALFRETYTVSRRPLLLLGLNPGPYGMAQSGIPFTDIRRLCQLLPRLARRIEERFGPPHAPGLAPRSLRPYLTRSFESSAVRVYRFLGNAFGSAEAGWRRTVVANPCPLLFIDPRTRKNRTPSHVRRTGPGRPALLHRIEELRRANAVDAVSTLRPRGIVLLGRDVQSALGPVLRQRLRPDFVIDWEHPARAVPAAWASGLISVLRHRRLLR